MGRSSVRVVVAGVAAMCLVACLVRAAIPRPAIPLRLWARAGVDPRSAGGEFHTLPDGPRLEGWEPFCTPMQLDGFVPLRVALGRIASRLRALGMSIGTASAGATRIRTAGGWDEWLVTSGPWPDDATVDPAVAGTWFGVPSPEEEKLGIRFGDTQFTLEPDGSGNDPMMGRGLRWARAGDAVFARDEETDEGEYDRLWLVSGPVLLSPGGLLSPRGRAYRR